MRANLRERFARELRFVQARLSPEGWLGLHLTVGALVVFLCTCGFAALGTQIGAAHALAIWDERVVQWFHVRHTTGATLLAFAVSCCGSVRFLVAATLIAAVVLWRRRMRNRLLVLSFSMIGSALLNLALKHFFHRQRPLLENPLVTLSSYGFPSGHTMGATVFYGFVGLIFARDIQNDRRSALVTLAAVLMIALVGLSRVYLGAHYPSDVAAAFLAGCAWLAFCWSGLETIRRRHSQPRKSVS